eukprot:CAMPEP_0113553502 /NCGR_PEP_ID=MMETSP0015_2-20120614/15646_1 /TAXON_ID=2838 /ORGANISM="Odontella" /LENGTH=959 /DNA_ID=CAMNT_0000454573 /DNA_START=270 /DNA_END=3149 /DNA_ORIENTATION=+ /assembly_acc=CAM_ASM_000160
MKRRKLAEAEATSLSVPPASTGAARKKLDNLAPLSGGGPVERAIKEDLSTLWNCFDEIIASSQSSNNNAADNNLTETTLLRHDVIGVSFRRFKDAFRRGKFGIIHTRCIPPRCDRADYEQVLYSACLGLLEDAMLQDEGDVRDLSPKLFGAACSVFSLYLLRETNPQPPFPTAERSALSTLTIGLVSEDPTKPCRRSYCEPIRISRKQYALLHMARDLALEVIALCESSVAKHWESIFDSRIAKVGGSTSAGSLCAGLETVNLDKGKASDSWLCTCGIARDCIHVIDMMCTDQLFDFCEYAGPCSVEGLAGSGDYYQKVLERRAHGSPGACELYNVNYSGDTVMGVEDRGDNLLSVIDLSDLDLLHRRYHELLDSARVVSNRSGSKKGDVLNMEKSRQLALVQEALGPVLSQRNAPNNRDILNQLQLCTAAVDEAQTDVGEISRGSQNEQRKQLQKLVTDANANLTGPATIANASVAASREMMGQVDESECDPRIVFSPTMSEPLKKGIGRALEKLLATKTGTSMSSHIAKDESFTKISSLSFPSVFEDDFLTANDEEESLVRREENSESSSENESDGSSEIMSRASTCTLIGQNALHKLLSKATARGRTEQTEKKKVAKDVCSTEMPRAVGDSQSIISGDGVGQAAISALLAEARLSANLRRSRKVPVPRKKAPTKKDEKLRPSQNPHDEMQFDNDSFITSDGAGQTALKSLLMTSSKVKKKANKRKASNRPITRSMKKRYFESAGEVDSLATGDGVGHAAIGALLSHAQSEQQGSQRCRTPGAGAARRNHDEKYGKLQSSQKPHNDVQFDTDSFNATDGAGQAALKSLLISSTHSSKVKKKANKRKASNRPITRSVKKRCFESAREVDSLATGDGAGHAAIGALLSHAQSEQQGSQRCKTRGAEREKPGTARRNHDDESAINEDKGEDASIETSSVVTGAGRSALQSLLLRVASNAD